jgi:hypothetical protein
VRSWVAKTAFHFWWASGMVSPCQVGQIKRLGSTSVSARCAVGDLVAAEAPTARTQPTRPDLSMSVYGKRNASPVTVEVVSASIATTPAGEVPVMLRPWIKATVPVELYPSRFVGRDYFGADCLLTPGGDDAAPDTQPVLSVLPSDYLTSNAAYLQDLAAYAVAEGRKPEEGAAFARWVISSEIMTFGLYDSAYEAWVRSLTCTMTARYAVLTHSRSNGAAWGWSAIADNVTPVGPGSAPRCGMRRSATTPTSAPSPRTGPPTSSPDANTGWRVSGRPGTPSAG